MIIYPTMKKANRKAKRRCKTIARMREQSRLAWGRIVAWEKMMESMGKDYMNRNSIREAG